MSCFRVQSYGHNHDNASIWTKKLHAFALFVNKLGILTSTLSKTHILSFYHYHTLLHKGCIYHLLQKKLPASTEVSDSKSPSVLTGNHYSLTESANGSYPLLLCNLDTLHYNGRKGLFAPYSVYSHFVCTLHFCTQHHWLSADCAVQTMPKSFCTAPTPVCPLSAPVCTCLYCRHTAHGSQQ